MPIKRRIRVSACHAVIAACTLCAIATSAHSADSPDPPGNTGLPCGYEVAAIIKGPVHPFFGQASLIATGMNELGCATGFYFWLDTDHAFYWPPDTGLHTIPLPAGFNRAIANDVNEHGVVVGDMEGPAQHWRGFVYDTNTGAMTILEPVQDVGSAQCWANAINNDGVVVGARSLGETQQPYNAFIWTPDKDEPTHGTYTDLGVMNGPNSEATALSENEHVAGWTGTTFYTSNAQGFVFLEGNLELIDPVPRGFQSACYGVNVDGEVVGESRIEGSIFGLPQAFVNSGGVSSALAPLPGDNMSFGRSINSVGVIVGTSRLSQANNDRACVWYDGGTIDLNSMVSGRNASLVLRNAQTINESGLIVVNASDSGKAVASLIMPVESSTADLTGDCSVGPEDLAYLLNEWGKRNSPADLNGDGIVNGADLAILLSNWTP